MSRDLRHSDLKESAHQREIIEMQPVGGRGQRLQLQRGGGSNGLLLLSPKICWSNI